MIQGTARRRNIGADAAIGVITTASFALGVALISKSRSFEKNFESALFGKLNGFFRSIGWNVPDHVYLDYSLIVAIVMGVLLWLIYGLALGLWPVVAANCVTLVLASSILWAKFRFRHTAPPPAAHD